MPRSDSSAESPSGNTPAVVEQPERRRSTVRRRWAGPISPLVHAAHRIAHADGIRATAAASFTNFSQNASRSPAIIRSSSTCLEDTQVGLRSYS